MKILCIDGGGIRGVFAIAILKAMEDTYNQKVSKHFDLIGGTSTGSIIAGAVALNVDMQSLLDQYLQHGEKIFMREAKVGLFKSIYSDRNLRTLLKKAFGDQQLTEVEKPLLIPAVDLTHGKPYAHRSYGKNEMTDIQIKLWDAVLSSCSAPVYFPPNNIDNKYLSIDGGLWANNPSLVCLTDSIHHFKQSLESIHILSLGTGKQNIVFSGGHEKEWGIKQWLPVQFPSFKVTPRLLDLALDISSESVSYHCELLLKENYMRVNKDLGKEMSFDDVGYMDKLIELGNEAFKENQAEIERFLEK
ncbi:CBASS cGAMP-activated phospholipase [Bacillus sp. B15-48]|uniref:CBASS cGAMP-activated phospholipase n=1 Tax=Bacillus sp. B15-48 TaxID=1548601 RepID=UPI0019401FDE|nr:CBASS cGAMP-activated phospholipase [Bacillus sp. B15-48]MBM4761903.1 patatin [Bacillus sp. B15-48]